MSPLEVCRWLEGTRWDLDMRPPIRARLAGGVSLGLWAAVAVCGRMIAYNWFDKIPAALAR